MLYRISNTAEKSTIEDEFGLVFKYPKLYRPLQIINGLTEETLSIITMDNPTIISFGIWGILPEKFEGDWDEFQQINNTLVIDENLRSSDLWHTLSLDKRRCSVIVNGFYTSLLIDGHLNYYHVHHISKKPFILAGIYNILQDGFITCSILTVKSNSFIRDIHNVNREMPLTLSSENSKIWLNSQSSVSDIKSMINSLENEDFIASPCDYV